MKITKPRDWPVGVEGDMFVEALQAGAQMVHTGCTYWLTRRFRRKTAVTFTWIPKYL
jgi:hypothetical protein